MNVTPGCPEAIKARNAPARWGFVLQPDGSYAKERHTAGWWREWWLDRIMADRNLAATFYDRYWAMVKFRPAENSIMKAQAAGGLPVSEV